MFLTSPYIDHCKLAVLNSLGSPASRRVYEYAIEQFIAWYCSEPLAFNRIVVTSTIPSGAYKTISRPGGLLPVCPLLVRNRVWECRLSRLLTSKPFSTANDNTTCSVQCHGP
jgi:hypothetical protein